MKGQKVVIEEGALGSFDSLVALPPGKRILIVADSTAWKVSGAAERLSAPLSRFRVLRFSDFEINPKLEDLLGGIERFREFGPDLVFAIGGGSAIDMAKLIAAAGPDPGQTRLIATGKVPVRERTAPPLIAVPTTSGSGSESTHFAVIYVDGIKYSVADPSLLPEVAIVDPMLTWSMPASLTASCGLDALCQAVESIWSVGANEESVRLAGEALHLVLNHLERAVRQPDPSARLAMSRAANLSGRAINISKTTAPHALSYTLTSRYGVPHGMAVALFLAPFLEFNSRVTNKDCNDPRGVPSVRERIDAILRVLEAASVEEAASGLCELIIRVGGPVRLNEVGVQPDEFELLAGEVNLQRLSNNPRRVEAAGLLKILQQIA